MNRSERHPGEEAAAPVVLDLAFRGLGMEVRGNAVHAISWLDEFLSPQLRDGHADRTRCIIAIDVDGPRYADRLTEINGQDGPCRKIDCFTLDGRHDQHVLVQREDHGRVIHDEQAEAIVAVGGACGDAERRIDICARRDTRRFRLTMMRVVREVATLHALGRGDLHVHGAAVVFEGRAYIVAGPKRAGKTSILLHALSRCGGTYVSNDRLLVEACDSCVNVHGMPTIVKVRPDCCDRQPGIPEMGWQRPCVSIDECERGAAISSDESHRPGSMSPAQLRRWLGVEATSGAPLAAVILPSVDAEVPGVDIRTLDSAEAGRRLAECLLGGEMTGRPPALFDAGWGGGASHGEAVAACAEIARRYPCIACRLGDGAFRDADLWRAIRRVSGTC